MLAVILMSSCGNNGEYTGYEDVPITGWPYGERLDYTVKIAGDTVATGDLELTLTHDNSYEYSNLWVELSYRAPSGSVIVDTVNIPMCDAYGNWYGRGLPGFYQLSHHVDRQPVTLADSCTVSVRHIMRVDTVRGISRVGIRYKYR